jgi:phosphoribosylformylglycinamidine cyclo-ligase
MPGMYADDEYDLAGTIVGVVERSKIVDGHRVRKGDILIGLPSNGLHTNGYSLARAVLLKDFTLEQHLDELGSTVGEALLAIHRSYMRAIRPLLRRFTLHGLSHITGGGIEGNTVRVVPKGRTLKLDWSAWKRPSIFQLIQDRGSVPEDDMRRTFNLGIGLIIIAAPKDADAIMRLLRKAKEESVVVGEIG